MLIICLNLLDSEEEKTKFEELYYTYRNLMFFAANELLTDEWMAEDAVQEALIRIAKNFHKVGEIKCHQTKNFVVIIVKNVSLTMLRKEKALVGDSIIEQMELVDMDDTAFDLYNYKKLAKQILDLPETYRYVIYLRCVYEYKVDEIAGLLGLTTNVVKKRLQRGKAYLRKRIEDECE